MNSTFLTDRLTRQDMERVAIVSVWDDVDEVRRISSLREDHFRDYAARAGYLALCQVVERHKTVSPMHIKTQMQASGHDEYFPMLLNTLGEIDSGFTPNWLDALVDEIKEHEYRRRGKEAIAKIANDLDDTSLRSDEIYSRALTSVGRAFAGSNSDQSLPLAECVKRLTATLEAKEAEQGLTDQAARFGYETGYTELDAKTGGVCPGDPLILAGKTSSGKSTMAYSIALHVVQTTGEPGYYNTAEMNKDKMARRYVARDQGVRIKECRADHSRAAEGNAPFLQIDDNRYSNFSDCIAAVETFKLKHPKMSIWVIDYIQLYAKTRDNQGVGEVSSLIWRTAARLNIAVVALSQLKRTDERPPELDDLRDSGSIEQDANMVWMLWRPDRDNSKAHGDPLKATCYVRKNRDGAVGKVALRWDPVTACYCNPLPRISVPPERELRDRYEQTFDGIAMEDIPL